jgi:serine/threonine protein kinase
MAEGVIGGRYELDERLGTGAMGEVWCATDLELQRRVAIKLLGRNADPARFEREARSAAALGHPNIVQLFDYGTHEGRPYMVLEYLPGGTLEERLTPGEPLSDAETASIARDVAAGLAHAHGRGLVHRDLKPGNVLFDGEGRAKIADLGIARMSGEGTLTEAGTVLGTAAYISPEQAAGQEAGPASDVYSFGVVLFLLLTGRLPFESSNPMELVRMHLQDTPPAVADLRPDAPAALESLTSAALAKDPAYRPPDGAALLAELESPTASTMLAAPATMVVPPTQGTRVIPVAAPPPVPRSRPVPARGLAIVGAALALAVAGVAAAVVATNGDSSDGDVVLPVPSLSVPSTSERTTTADVATTATTDAATTTAATTTAPTTTRPATTQQATTRPATTQQATTAPTPPTTVVTEATPPPPPPPTTETVPTVSEPPPATTATTTAPVP